MSRREQLNKLARRQLEDIGRASGDRYVAERADIYRAAKKLIEDTGTDGDDFDSYDVLAVARFLAGDMES